jgi:hypothetical protein
VEFWNCSRPSSSFLRMSSKSLHDAGCDNVG